MNKRKFLTSLAKLVTVSLSAPTLLNGFDNINSFNQQYKSFVINTNGNIGLGSPDPSHQLHICAPDGIIVLPTNDPMDNDKISKTKPNLINSNII